MGLDFAIKLLKAVRTNSTNQITATKTAKSVTATAAENNNSTTTDNGSSTLNPLCVGWISNFVLGLEFGLCTYY